MVSNTCLNAHEPLTRSIHAAQEELLVIAAQDGGSAAFVELSDQYRAKLIRRTYRITRNWTDAEDIAQEALIRAYMHLHKLQDRASFSTWLTRIAINLAPMRLRKKATANPTPEASLK